MQDDSYEPYIPVAQRREAKLAKFLTRGNTEKEGSKKPEEIEVWEDAEREEENRREKARKERTLLVEAEEVHSKKAIEGKCSLCRLCQWLTSLCIDAQKTEGEKAEEADAEILAAIARRRKLASDLELAKGIQYTKSIGTSYVKSI